MRQRTARVGATTCGEALRTSCSPWAFLTALGQKMQQTLTAGQRHRGPYTCRHAPRCQRAYGMLVESDIRAGVRGILP